MSRRARLPARNVSPRERVGSGDKTRSSNEGHVLGTALAWLVPHAKVHAPIAGEDMTNQLKIAWQCF